MTERTGVNDVWPHSDYLRGKDAAVDERVIAGHRRDTATNERDRSKWEDRMVVCGRHVEDWTAWLSDELDRRFDGDRVLL